MPSLPHLPFGVTYAAIGAVVLAVVGAIVQQVFADQLRATLKRLWQRFGGRRRSIRRDEWVRYRDWAADAYSVVKLGFLRDVAVTLNDVYVPLQYEQDGQRIDIYHDLQNRLRTVVVGAAGAGKSMLLRHSVLQWAADPQRFDRVPVLIELARYNRGERSIQQLIVETLTYRVEVGKPRRHHKRLWMRPLVDDAEKVVATALDTGRLCVFLDGLDEVITERRANLMEEIKEFAEQNPTCQVVVTCRDAVYDDDLQPTFDRQIRIAGFDDAGIRHFLRLWFTGRRDATKEDEQTDAAGNVATDPRESVEQLMAALRASPTLMRLARSPLMLTMITSLHDADPGLGPTLTNSRAEFYEQAIDHLLRRDHDLGRHRDLARYRAGHKGMALRAVALAAQGAAAHGADRRVITEQELYTEMSRLLPRFGLTDSDAPKMVNEIVDRSGLLIRIDENNLLYKFAHLTLQEYLAAMELADAPDQLLKLYQGNPGRWRETMKLWCGGANRDASTLVGQIFAGDAPDRLLALECVAEARQIDSALAGRIVDSFVAQLGTNIADKHLVLAALGAVAADRDPVGQALFNRLRHVAEDGDQIGDDAIIALAESRRREAIETLSELALKRPTAREALRATGELAIPVLADRARAGSVTAVDDLAAIGTPAAATAITEQLWGERPIAARAAWRLAELIGAPGVEGELARFDPAPFQKGDRDYYDWLWVPFTSTADGHQTIVVTMGRVGWLLDKCGDAEVPTDLSTVDARLALGVGAWRYTFRSHAEIPAEIHEELKQEIAEAAHRFGYRHQSRRPRLGASESTEMLDLIANKHPETARMFASRLLAVWSQSTRHALLLNHLPTPPLIDLVKLLWYSFKPFDTDIRDWRTLNERPEPPRLLLVVRNTAIMLAVLLGIGAAGIGLTRSVGTLIGWWSWGPRWFAAAVLLTVAIAIGAALYGYYFLFATDANLFTAVIAGVLACVGVLIVALSTVAGWLGWLATISIVVLAVGSVTLFSIWTSRRERALRNPYRALLQRDARSAIDGGTVIARQLANGGQMAAPSGTEAPPHSAPLTPATRS